MTTQNKSSNEDDELNERYDIFSLMATVAQLAEETNISKGLVYKILNEPGGPPFVKLGKKTLVNRQEWARYLESKTIRREAIEVEVTANAARDATEVKELAEAADTRASAPPRRRGRPPLKRTA